MTSISQYKLPCTVAHWPWPRRLNPHYKEVKDASETWFRSLHAFDPKSQVAFEKCDFSSLLASLAYPSLDNTRLRTGCDLMMLFFVFDEYTDEKDAGVVKCYADIVMDAIRNPGVARPQDECILGEIARQFWELAISSSSPSSRRRFITKFDQYTDAVVQQARDRDSRLLRSIEDYFAVRRLTIGTEPSYIPLELEMCLPDEVIDHPTIVALSLLVTDMIILDNDLCSYNKEQAAGDDLHNIIPVVMHELGVNIHGALEWVAMRHAHTSASFLQSFTDIPSWGEPVDGYVRQYIQGLGNWVRANDCWNFESGRYFGTDGLQVQQHRTVYALPNACQ